MTCEYPCPSCSATVDVQYEPGRPAPYCQNPSSPAYSDPGDPGDLDMPEVCPACTEPLDESAAWYWCETALRRHNEL